MFKKSKKGIFGVMDRADLTKLFMGGDLFKPQGNINDMFSFTEKPKTTFVQPHTKEELTRKIREELVEASKVLYRYAHRTYHKEVLARVGFGGAFVGEDGISGDQRLMNYIVDKVKAISFNRNRARPSSIEGSFVKPEDIERARMSLEREVSERAGVKLTGGKALITHIGRGIVSKKEKRVSDRPVDYRKEYGHTQTKKGVVPPRSEASKRATAGLIYDKFRLSTFDRAQSVYCSKCGAPLKVKTEGEGKNAKIVSIESPCPNCGKELKRTIT